MVHWPHEAILVGTARQHVTYDQLTLTQWVQGLCYNILEEKSGKHKDLMFAYLGDLMEDATDFSWQGAKAAHVRDGEGVGAMGGYRPFGPDPEGTCPKTHPNKQTKLGLW